MNIIEAINSERPFTNLDMIGAFMAGMDASGKLQMVHHDNVGNFTYLETDWSEDQTKWCLNCLSLRDLVREDWSSTYDGDLEAAIIRAERFLLEATRLRNDGVKLGDNVGYDQQQALRKATAALMRTLSELELRKPEWTPIA
jgi:hypothetical protein